MSSSIIGRYRFSSVIPFLFFTTGLIADDSALIAGQNINMVSGTEWPGGDPYLQRQNEPTISISTRNELHLMGGSNDYRTVDLPGLPEGKTTGDSWLSSYFSYDGGGRWNSVLLPGYPQDDSPLGVASPLRMAGYEASADPVIRSGTHGLFYYSGIAFNRGIDPPSAGFVALYMDLNNDERGNSIGYVGTTVFDENADGSSFIDKPWIAVDKPRGGAVTRTFDVNTDSGVVEQTVDCGNLYVAYARIQGEDSTAVESQIMFTRSVNCAASFDVPKVLTLPDTINQGAAIAVEPLSGRIQVAWRQFADATMSCTNKFQFWSKNAESWPVEEIELAGMLLRKEEYSTPADDDDSDSGDSGSDSDDDDIDSDSDEPTNLLRELLAAWLNILSGADSSAVDQTLEDAEAWLVENPVGSNPKKMIKKEGKKLRKTLSKFNKGKIGPGSCKDLEGAGLLSGMNPNAIMVVSSDDNGDTFSAPVAISGPNYFPFEQGTTGYSFRSTGYPTMVFDGDGRSYVAYTTRGLAVPDFDAIGGDGRIVVTTSSDGTNWTFPLPIDEPETRGHQLMPAFAFSRDKVFLLYYDFREDVSGVFDRFVTDLPVDFSTSRHSVDVRAAQAHAAAVPIFTDYSVLDQPSTQASRYPFLVLTKAGAPFSQQTQYNPPNLPMFKGGLVPFFGDFIDIAALAFVNNGMDGWDFDLGTARGAPVVHAVWTDNRDVVAPLDGDWTSYIPPVPDGEAPSGRTSIFDPTKIVPACVPGDDPSVIDRTQMRNQNIYTSRLTQGLVFALPGNNRPLGTIQRVFVGFVQNLTDQDKIFRLQILNIPSGVSASFEQFAADTEIDEVVKRNSSVARSIFVSSTDPSASVDISVTEVDSAGMTVLGGLTGTARINADPSAPDPTAGGILTEEIYTPAIFNPAIFNPAIFNPALLGPGMVANPDDVGIFNPAIFNSTTFNDPKQAEFISAALAQLAILNPAIFNPAIFNLGVANPAIFNPAIFNSAIFNPAIFNPAIFNPAIFNPAIFNPAIFNLGVGNPAIFNPAIFNPAIFNSTLVETSVVIENKGNTTAAYSLNLDLDDPPMGFIYQVMIYRTYLVPSVEGCAVTESIAQEQLVNELTPDVNGNLLSSDSTSFYLAPGDNVVATVRIVPDPNAPGDPTTINTLLSLNLSQAVVPQAVDTEGLNNGETEPPSIVVLAPSLPPLVINAVDLADGTVGISYAVTLGTTGGDASPIGWTLVPGSSLPAGLSLTAGGQIMGTPTTAGVFPFDVRAQDDDQVAEGSFSITVAAVPISGVDQQQPTIATSTGALAIGGNSTQKLAQTVTAGITGSLIEVRLPVSCSVNSDLDVQIQRVTAGEPDGFVLAEAKIDSTALPPFSGTPIFRSIAFQSPAFITAGQQFGIVMTSTGSCSTLPGPNGDSYTSGVGYFDALPNLPGWVPLFTRLDLPFQTVVNATSIPPPPVVSTTFRADFDFSAEAVTGPYICLRTQWQFDPANQLIADTPLTAQLFDTHHGPQVGNNFIVQLPFNTTNVGHELIIPATGIADGIGHLQIQFSQPTEVTSLLLQGLTQGLTAGCYTGAQSNFVTANVCNIDQSNDPAPTGGSSVPGLAPLGQSFTPAASSFNSVDLYLNLPSVVPSGIGVVEVRIHSGSIAGPLIATSSNTVTVTNAALPIERYRFNFVSPVAVTPGNLYVIEVVHTAGATVGVWGAGATYPGGTRIIGGAATSGDISFELGTCIP